MAGSDFVSVRNFGFQKSKLHSFGISWQKETIDGPAVLKVALRLEEPKGLGNASLKGHTPQETVEIYAALVKELIPDTDFGSLVSNVADEMEVDM